MTGVYLFYKISGPKVFQSEENVKSIPELKEERVRAKGWFNAQNCASAPVSSPQSPRGRKVGNKAVSGNGKNSQ